MADMAIEIPEVRLDTWDQLTREFDAPPSWVFRGQASANWPLLSTLDRRTPQGYPKQFAEFNLCRDFRRHAHTYLQPLEIPDTPGEWLALMQHYGAPTRLLDFTRSPFVAAYFAFEDPPADGCDRCAIWAIEPGWCHTQFGYQIWHLGGIFDLGPNDFKAAMEASTKNPPKESGGGDKPGYEFFMLGSVLALSIDKHAQTKAPPLAAIFEPERLSVRMSTQQGVFLWPGDVTKTAMENLTALGNIGMRGIRKLTIPLGQRGRALDQLRLMNTTRTSLFPGLEGFAQSFRQALVRETKEDRDRRLALHALREAHHVAPSLRVPEEE